MDWLAKQVIEELKCIIRRQSAVLKQVTERKEDAKLEYEINKNIETEMIQEEWMMKKAILLLKDAYEDVYLAGPNLEGINREETILTNNEE